MRNDLPLIGLVYQIKESSKIRKLKVRIMADIPGQLRRCKV